MHFGGVRALSDVSFTMSRGEALGLVGPNGSGKSTLLNFLCGIVPGEGVVSLDGRRLRSGRPRDTRAARVLRTFQTPQVFDRLTCLENVQLADRLGGRTGLAGAWLRRRSMHRVERRRRATAMAALDRVKMSAWAGRFASELSYGQRRFLEMARAIAGDPVLLLLDEPSAGLNAVETSQLREIIKGAVDEGIAVLLVDHKMDFLGAVCDRLMVLEMGRVLAEGTVEDVMTDPRVIDAYLGTRRA